MGEIVNLRRARKRQGRASARNRCRRQSHSPTASPKRPKQQARAERERAEQALDGPPLASGTTARAMTSSLRRADRAAVVKRSLTIAGHRTSISIEDAFWRRLKALAAERGRSLGAMIAEIDAARDGANLSSAIRVFVLESAAQ